jgi:calcium-dependent protein kinase
MMHRDIKPENIMMRSKNSLDPVIGDFGLAEKVDSEDYLYYKCGTPGFVAP